MVTYYSHGKLLLTGEYAVLNGANALAVPCKKGQNLNYSPKEKNTIIWKSIDINKAVWFEAEFKVKTLELITTSDSAIWKSLHQLLKATRELNSAFLAQGGQVCTHLEFERSWGLGSSSTLISNIALWANINPYQLLEKSFGGSGCDIACAQAKMPLTYKRKQYDPTIESIKLDYPFSENLFFVHLNQKIDSQKAVASFYLDKVGKSIIKEINKLTEMIIRTSKQDDFNLYLKTHETILGTLLNQKTVQKEYFSDFKGVVKSLGAWGGDFILVSGDEKSPKYFEDKGYPIIIPFKEMIL